MAYKIDVQGEEKVVKRIERISRVGMYQEVSEEVALYVRDELRKSPDNASNRPSRRSVYGTAFFTAKQRKFFFYALKAGIISVPYKRTGKLAKGWKVISDGKEVSVKVGTRFRNVSTGRFMKEGEIAQTVLTNGVEYVKHVQAHKTQARYMKAIDWKTDRETIEKVPVKVVKEKARQVVRRYAKN